MDILTDGHINIVVIFSAIRKENRKRFFLGVVIFFLINNPLGMAQQKSSLSKIRQEIQRLENELNKKDKEEVTLLEQVENIEREIGLKEKLIGELDSELKRTEKKVKMAEEELNEILDGFNRLTMFVKKRMLRMYKRGRFMDWEVFFSIRSLNQAVVWLKYQKRIIENDQRNMKNLEEKRIGIENQRSLLRREIQAKTKLLQENNEERKSLEAKKKNRKNILAQVRKDKGPLLEQLREKKIAYQEIEKRISYEETKRKTTVQKLDGSQFAGLKGKMRWPAKGEIVSSYGRQRHPVLKTWTENLGIDIKAANGTNVQAVSRGIVRYVTWLRGMGNLVLLDHGGGYYSVYAHLAVVFVETDDELREGDVIGQVGTAQSLYQTNLHFEIWKEQNHFDPVSWLR